MTTCPRCGEPVVGAFGTEPGFEEYEPCGCRVATDGGVVEDAMPRMKFANEYVAPIIYDEKTATVRLDGPDLRLRDRVKATDEDGRLFALLEIRGLATADVFDVVPILEIFNAEYPAETSHDVIDGLRKHYDEQITPSTSVDIYVFEHARLPGDDDGGGV